MPAWVVTLLIIGIFIGGMILMDHTTVTIEEEDK